MKNIVLIGIMGCGKTTIGKELSLRLDRPVIDLDEYLVKKYNMTIPEMFNISESYFRDRETECCEDISKWEGYIISTGGGVIKNNINIEYLKANGIVIYIDRPIENILKDIEISSRPLLKDGSQKLYELYEQRHELYLKSCDYHIMNNGTMNEVIDKVLKIIS